MNSCWAFGLFHMGFCFGFSEGLFAASSGDLLYLGPDFLGPVGVILV